MKRKVVKLGPSTLVVSLPTKWIKEHAVQPGDEIDVDIEEGMLQIQSETAKKECKTIEVTLTEENKHNMRHILTHCYRKGYDIITVKGLVTPEISTITNTLLLGFEVTKRDSKTYVIENVAEISSEKYEVMLRRAFLVIKETHQLLEDSLARKNFDTQQNTELRDQFDKYFIFCQRVIYASKEKSSVLSWSLLTDLMVIQHSYHYLYVYLTKHGFVQDDDLTTVLSELKEYFNLLYEATFQNDIQKVHLLHKKAKEFQFGKCYTLLESKKNIVAYSFIRQIFRISQLSSSPLLAELLL